MKKILVPVDFSDVSQFGIEIAKKVAKTTNVELHLLHIITLPSHVLLDNKGDLMEDGEMDTSEVKTQKIEAEIKMKALIESLTDFNIHTCICYGHVNEEVLKYAQKNTMDLIVMGTHGSTGIKEYITGSHAEHVAMHATAPVFTVKCDRSEMLIKSLVFTNSFSHEVENFPSIIKTIQEAFHAELHLLRVNTPNSFMVDDEVLANMKKFADKYELADVKYSVINDREVESGIEKYCLYNNIDVISIGSRQRTGVNKLINGCVSADLVNHVFKPIITYKI
jgi:nucleotide-binding universal stress UspA family protein